MSEIVVDTYHPMVPNLDDRGNVNHGLLVVLVANDVGKLCCYMGIVVLPSPSHRLYEKTRAMKAQRVATKGFKMTYKQASSFMKNIRQADYIG